MLKLNWLKEYIKIAIRNVKTRRLRSWLTIIGILIGVFLIVSLISLSEGLKGAVMQQLSMMGKDLITVMPGDISAGVTSMIGGGELTDEDIKTMKKVNGVDIVVPMNYKAETMRYGDSKKTVIIYGNPWKDALEIYVNDMGWSINKGRWPIPGKSETVIGSIVAKEIFPGIEVGDSAVIKGRKLEIVGILNSVGSKQDDSMVGVDLDIFKSITGETKGAKAAFLKIKAGYSADKLAETIKSEFEDNKKRKRGQEPETASYSVLTSEKISSIVGSVMGLIQAVIIGFASIAIVVGGIGIMNTMYTAVRERTKEIGVMKAIGAKTSTINIIFLIESGIFGLIGGLGGTAFGLLLSKSIEIYLQIHPLFYIKADVSPGLILFSLSFSFLVGCTSGFFPARTASKLKPVDALRYE
ncbi:MAG: ABC transporter permease [Candidatus Nealsonbacteria bacterium]|nr:ABC transporter permease [Candidatus Nealsonbacteria bacterium]